MARRPRLQDLLAALNADPPEQKVRAGWAPDEGDRAARTRQYMHRPRADMNIWDPPMRNYIANPWPTWPRTGGIAGKKKKR